MKACQKELVRLNHLLEAQIADGAASPVLCTTRGCIRRLVGQLHNNNGHHDYHLEPCGTAYRVHYLPEAGPGESLLPPLDECLCGCGLQVARGRNFRPGHHTRLRYSLLRVAEDLLGEPHLSPSMVAYRERLLEEEDEQCGSIR